MLSHIAILLMRGRRPPCYGAINWQSKVIEPTDEAACLRVYHDIDPDSKNDSDVPRLLSALGNMPFAVTLMANLGAESRVNAKDLLDSWSESGTKILSNDPEQSMDLLVRAIAAHGNVRVPVILFFLFECTLNYNLATFQSREW